MKQSVRAITLMLISVAIMPSTTPSETFQLLPPHPRLMISILVALRSLEKPLNEPLDATSMLKPCAKRVKYILSFT